MNAKNTKNPKPPKAGKETPADVPLTDVVPTPAPVDAEVPPILVPETTDAAAPTSETPAADAPAEPPPAPVIVTFARPPLEVEGQIRIAVQEGKPVVGIRAYLAWSRTTDKPVDMMEAQDAVYWLCAQPLPVPEVVEEPTPETTDAEPGARLRLVPRPAPAPVVATITPTPPPRQRVIKAVTIDHSFELLPGEHAAFGDQLAATVGQLAAMKADHAAQRRTMKLAETAIEGEQARLASILQEGREVRKVSVHVVADYVDGVQRTIVDDTGVVIDERPLEEKDRQLSMFGPPRVKETAAEAPGMKDAAASDSASVEQDDDEDNDADEE